MSGKLVVVGTPIGNLSDFSPRAIENLQSADFIAAEDTRVTLKLLNHFGVKKEMISYFEHNKKTKGEKIIQRIESGQVCVLVSDAGMPAISDPGEELVRQCIKQNIEVTVVPGPTALTAALAISGLPTGRFTFEGFLSVNKKSRFEHLESLKTERRTMVFYEAPHKLKNTLADMTSAFGDRDIAIVRELTKIHEEVLRTTLKSACEKFKDEKIKGEIVLIVSGDVSSPKKKEYSLDEATRLTKELIEKGMSVSEAAKKISKQTLIKKGDIYKNVVNYDKITDKNDQGVF